MTDTLIAPNEQPTCPSLASSAETFAKDAFKRRDFEAAQVAFKNVADLTRTSNAGKCANALANQAQCFLNLSRPGDARAAASEALRLDDNLVKAWFRLGVSEARLRRFDEAEAALQQAQRLQPTDSDIEIALLDVRRRRTEGVDGCFAWTASYARFLETFGGQSLALEPFVGPIQVAHADGRGRGLFLTADVRRGQLLLCAEALVVADNDALIDELGGILGQSPPAYQLVMALSRGSPDSEQKLPNQTSDELAMPGLWARPPPGTVSRPGPPPPHSELKDILRFNQHAISYVNPNAAPVQITSDRQRSGLWLLPAFLNHSCRPNVQRLIAYDRFLLRAACDLEAGTELLDCYIETLQPLAQRRESLKSYGFHCLCERCEFEEAVLDGVAVSAILEEGVKAKSVESEKGQAAASDVLESAVQRAEALVGKSLESHLCKHCSSIPSTSRPWFWGKLPCLPTGCVPIPAPRVAQLRWGFEDFDGDNERAIFKVQEQLHNILLASMFGLIRQQAITLKGNASLQADQATAWRRLMEVLDEVLPCSELRAATSSELFYVLLINRHLDYRSCKKELRDCLLAHHEAYGGGANAWHALNKQMFSPHVVEGVKEAWPAIRKEFNFPRDDYDPSDFKPKPRKDTTRQSIGFEDRLKRELRTGKNTAKGHALGSQVCQDKHAHTEKASKDTSKQLAASKVASLTTLASDEAKPAAQTDSEPCGQAVTSEIASPPEANEDGQSTNALADLKPEYELEDLGSEIVIRASIPGVHSAAQAELEVSKTELRIRGSACPNSASAIVVPLPRAVDADSARAKWLKRTEQLVVRLTIAITS